MKRIVLISALLFAAVAQAQQTVPVTVPVSVPASTVMAPTQSVAVPQSMVTIPVRVDGLPTGCVYTATGGTTIVVAVTGCGGTPPPTKVPSADGATITPANVAASLIDLTLNTWTFGTTTDSRGTTVNLNGSATSSACTLLLYYNKLMYCQTSSGAWWGAPGQFATRQPGDPRPVAGVPTVTLQWSASPSTSIKGYNVYRGTQSGGPYSKLTPSPVTLTSYTDAAVAHLQKYFYNVTALGDPLVYATPESGPSNESSATP